MFGGKQKKGNDRKKFGCARVAFPIPFIINYNFVIQT